MTNMEKILPDTDIGGDIDENGAPQEGERAADGMYSSRGGV